MITRRTFIRHIGAAGALPIVLPRLARASSPNGKLQIAGIGVGGKGWSDLENTSAGQSVVAICDVDRNHLARAADAYPDAREYVDWRELLQADDVDACTISTPDHMHAPIAMAAMRGGKHVYVQKPLTHSVHEARALTEAAKRYDVVTQMGTQGHSRQNSQLLVALLRNRAIGRIRHIHLWTDRPIWPQGMDRPSGSHDVPGHLEWDLWLGVAPERPYYGQYVDDRSAYHPFTWRGWHDFGTGALGDIGCHRLVPVWDGLQMQAPLSVRSVGPVPNAETFPNWGTVHYRFGETAYSGGPFDVTWYDGGKLPDPELFHFMEDEGWRMPASGRFIVGDEGYLYGHRLYPRDRFGADDYPEVEGDDHYQQWTRACLDRSQQTLTAIDTIGGPATEAVLLGNVALHYPEQELAWDSAALRFPDKPEADQRLRRAYRDGWQVQGL